MDRDLCAIEEALSTIVRQSKSRRQHERVAELGAVSLETSMYPLLRRIAESGPRLTELSEMLNIDASVISRQVRQLEDRNLVARTADPDDRRAATLSLTPAGNDALAAFRAARRRRIAELLDGWSRRDRATFATLLTRLATALEDAPDASSAAHR